MNKVLILILIILVVALYLVKRNIKQGKNNENLEDNFAETPVVQEEFDENLMDHKNKALAANISCDLDEFKKNITNNYQEICKYPEIKYIAENDVLQVFELIWENFNSPHNDVVEIILDKFPRYSMQVMSHIVAVENARITNYMHMQKFMTLKKIGMKEFAEYYSPEEKDLYVRTYVKLCHVEDMVKAADIYRKSDGRYSYYIFNYGPIKDPESILKVFLFQDGDLIEMTVEEFRGYCVNKNVLCPL